MPNARELHFAFTYPEIAMYGGGGTGQSQDATPVDQDGVSQRAIDLRFTYRVGIASLDVEAVITNRSRRSAALRLQWAVDADYADIQEALGGSRQQTATVQRRIDRRQRMGSRGAQLTTPP